MIFAVAFIPSHHVSEGFEERNDNIQNNYDNEFD